MGLKSYLVRAFEHSHESQMFDHLVNELTRAFESSPSQNLLIGNILIDGRDLDALLITGNAISVIEMKSHGGKLTFRENLPWLMNGTTEVRGGSWANPFQQVRAYRMAVKNFFQAHEGKILEENRTIEWHHTSATVVFGKAVDFEDSQLSYSLKLWLHITDLSRVGKRMAALMSPKLQLRDCEIIQIKEVLGLGPRQLYFDGKSETVALPGVSSELASLQKPPRVIYLKELNFRETEYRLRTWGGERSVAAQRIRELLEQLRQGVDALLGLTATHDDRIDGAARYKISPHCELLIIHAGVCLIPAAAGTVDEVDGWINTHAGLTVTINTTNERIEITSTIGQRNIPKEMATPALSSETRSFLSRTANLNLEELGIPRLVRNALMELDEASTTDDIKDALEAVSNEDHRLFLYDIINLVRSGDTQGANTRMLLRAGEMLPVQDAGQHAVEAASSSINSGQAFLLNDLSKEMFEKLLDPEHFQDWMLFLHPDQNAFVKTTFDRPVVLTGVSGSGKTCILVHRARVLTKRYPGQKIGIMTLSKSLAGLLQNLVNQLCDKDERRYIEVIPVYEHFKKCLEKLGIVSMAEQFEKLLPSHALMNTTLRRHIHSWPRGMVWDCDPISREYLHENWEEFYMQRNPDVADFMNGITRKLEALGIDASRYLNEELTLVRSGHPIPSRHQSYLEMARSGRVIPFDQELRKDVLAVTLFWEDWLLHGGMIDDLGLTLALMPLRQEMQQLSPEYRFRCLLVDEFQDLSTMDLQIIRRIVPIDEPDSLFLAGDTIQRVLVKRLTLAGAGLDKGPALHRSITKNYRNSRQILRAAAKLANHYGAVAQAQGEDIEFLDPELAQRETNPPVVIKTDHAVAKAWELVMECLNASAGADRWTVCIVTAAPDKLPVASILHAKPSIISARELSGDSVLRPHEVTVGAITDLKGFEFRLVIIVGCSNELLPSPGVPPGETWRDALRLYVAMTRGRDQVYLVHENLPSEYIGVMDDTVILREEVVRAVYETEALPPNAIGPTLSDQAVTPRSQASILDPDENCEDKLTASELEALRRYYAQKVHRDNLTFREWCCPRNLSKLRTQDFARVRHLGPREAQQVIYRLAALGITGTEYAPLRIPANPGICRVNGCNAIAIPGEEHCYEHKTE